MGMLRRRLVVLETALKKQRCALTSVRGIGAMSDGCLRLGVPNLKKEKGILFYLQLLGRPCSQI